MYFSAFCILVCNMNIILCFAYLSDFNCSANYTAGTYLAENNHVIAFNCSVEFSGAWRPNITCAMSERTLQVDTASFGVTNVTTVFSVRANRTINNRPVTCRVRFLNATKPSSSLQAADNIPDYDASWPFDKLLVTCKLNMSTLDRYD